MATAFDSTGFYRDPFFTQTAAGESGVVAITAGGVTASLPFVLERGLDPKRDGALLQRPGNWAQLSVLISDYRAAFGPTASPAPHDIWVTEGESFDVDNYSRDGDSFTVKAISKQRTRR